jgi:IS4 transposase
MKSKLKYEIQSDTMYQTSEGLMAVRIQQVVFTKNIKGEEPLKHLARIITYPDVKGRKLISLQTNDMEMDTEDIIAIYRKRWEIELLFKQIKQNFPLRYFYGESANAIKIQIWVTLIANLLLMILQRTIKRRWSFSGLATMVRIMMMYYIDFRSFFKNPEKDWIDIMEAATGHTKMPSLFDPGGLEN